jgi:hypothetical protein
MPKHRNSFREASNPQKNKLKATCMKNILFLLLSFVLLLSASTIVSACSCEPIDRELSVEEDIELRLKKFDAVFSGKVLRIKNLKVSADNPFPSAKVTLKVLETWKGIKTKKITVFTYTTDCGFKFEAGESYLVYGNRQKNNLVELHRCTSTKKLSFAENELKVINKLVKP